MEVIIFPTEEKVSEFAANYVASHINNNPKTVLGLPTGSSPLGMFRNLIKKYENGVLDFSEVTTFNLDEYVGLIVNHPQSYNSFMYKNFFNYVNIKPHNINIPDGLASDVNSFCKLYEERIKNVGGIDLMILGIGRTGHIGFNEPSSSLSSRTRLKTLTKTTREDNARFFNSIDEVPRHVITMGIGTILDSKECMLIATGVAKAEAIATMVEGNISAMVPATALQYHKTIKVVLDEDAASKLLNKDYYKYVYNEKPAWQYI